MLGPRLGAIVAFGQRPRWGNRRTAFRAVQGKKSLPIRRREGPARRTDGRVHAVLETAVERIA
jgi:hypothetical protein